MKFRKIVYEAVGSVYANKVLLVTALFIPFLLYTAINAIDFLDPGTLISILLIIPMVVVETKIAVTIHRVVLLGPNSVSKKNLFKWTERETTFVFYYMILGGILYPFFYLEGIPDEFDWIIFVLFFLLAMRFSLVFPAIALDQKISLKDSWRWTKNHKFLMSLVVLFIFSLFYILIYAFYILVPDYWIASVAPMFSTFCLSIVLIFILILILLVVYLYPILFFLPIIAFFALDSEFLMESVSQISPTLIGSFVITVLIVFEVAILSIAYKYICKEANEREPIASGEA